jgi:hypothetical protein
MKKGGLRAAFFLLDTDSNIYAIGIEEDTRMKTKKSIEHLQQKLLSLGPVLPGSISEQWNVCGTPGCKCKDTVNPKKHGPYYQLSFSVGGRSSSMFIKKEDIAEARKRVKRYQEFKKLTMDLVQAYVDMIRTEGFRRDKHGR